MLERIGDLIGGHEHRTVPQNSAETGPAQVAPNAGIVRHLRPAGPRTGVSAVLQRERRTLEGGTP